MICPKSKRSKNILDQQNHFELPNSKYSIKIFTDVEDVKPYWTDFQSNYAIFLQCEYLAAIQNAQIEGLEYRYILVQENEKVVGFIPLQIKDFDAKKQILNLQKEQHFSIRNQVSNFIKFHSVVNGNILVSGPYMYAFTSDVPSESHWELNQKVIAFYQQKILVTSESNVNFTLVKDIPQGNPIHHQSNSYTSFSVEPVMKLPIREHWNKLEDYLSDMTSKYRVRYRRAAKKMEGISSKILSMDDILKYKNEIHVLYRNVLNNVNFTLFELSENYFISLSKYLEENYVLKGFFQDNRLVGFYTLIKNNDEIHADYLGYDADVNRTNQLYLNMLYDMVDYGIVHASKKIDFGRTALEIKSSIGAIPYQMNDLIKHKYQFTNIIIPKLVQILNKETEWVQRHPFKSNS